MAGRGKAAFTLIELLVVVTIIAILAAMLLPAISRARDTAIQTACLNTMKQFGMGIALYADEFNGVAPHGGRWQSDQPSMTYIMFQRPADPFYAPYPDEPVNLALLAVAKILGSLAKDEYLRCPSTAGVSDCRGDPAHYNYVLSPKLGTWVNHRADYVSQQFRSFATMYRGPRLDQVGDHAFYADLFASATNVKSMHRRGVNVLYGDSAGRWMQDEPGLGLATPGRDDFMNPPAITAFWAWFDAR